MMIDFDKKHSYANIDTKERQKLLSVFQTFWKTKINLGFDVR